MIKSGMITQRAFKICIPEYLCDEGKFFFFSVIISYTTHSKSIQNSQNHKPGTLDCLKIPDLINRK